MEWGAIRISALPVSAQILREGPHRAHVEDGRYRACRTVCGGALFFAATTKPPVQTEGLEERSTLWVAGARFEPTTVGL
jgi:hypothetical protein